MHHVRKRNQVLVFGAAISLGLGLSLSYAGPSSEGRSVSGPTAGVMMYSVPTMGTKERPASSVFVSPESTLFLRSLPTVSKEISVGGTTVVPYIGAGFWGGHLTEYDRSLHVSPTPSTFPGSANIGLRSVSGQHLMPNEVQLGIRFPF